MAKSPDVSFTTRVSNKLFPKRAARKALMDKISKEENAQSLKNAEMAYRRHVSSRTLH